MVNLNSNIWYDSNELSQNMWMLRLTTNGVLLQINNCFEIFYAVEILPQAVICDQVGMGYKALSYVGDKSPHSMGVSCTRHDMIHDTTWYTTWHDTRPGGRFKNTYELLNLRALKFSYVNKIHIFQCMGKIFCVEFQRYPLKFHTKYLTHTLKDMIFMQFWNFKSS